MAGDPTLAAMISVRRERERQRELIEAGRIPHACEDPDTPDGYKLAVLAEEFGEVAKALNEGAYPADLREELIQVAAVAVAWVEGLDAVAEFNARHAA